jgi:uncharacterized membrane protein YccC
MPTLDELVFALKTFASAMLALYLACWLGLDNPYWAMTTAFIVAQPLTGAMRSKAAYRFAGTFAGGTAAVVMVPTLVNAPVLLCLAIALWIGLCLYLSLLDRSPRAYMFMLAGYTAGIIGLASVGTPGDIFTTALTRVEEISLGIACTTIIGTLVFPRALGPVLVSRMVAWLKPGQDWAVAALTGAPEDAEMRVRRRRLAAEAADIAMMTSQLSYDTSHLQDATRHMARLRIYALSLMPVLSSVADRVAQLRAAGGIDPALKELLAASADWVKSGGPEDAGPLHAQIEAMQKTAGSHGWANLIRTSLLERLNELVSIIRHARAIRRHVAEGDPAPENALVEAEFIAVAAQLKDHGLALLSAAAAATALLTVCAFWIFTAWPAGGGAAVMVAVACSFFAAQDDPAPAIALMLRNTIIVTMAAFVYEFAILPRVETFGALALVLLPAIMVIGVLISRPATFGTGMVLGAFGSTDLALGNGYAGNVPVYLNNALAVIMGLAAALVVTKLMRSVGAAWSANRLLRAGWRDIARAAEHGGVERAVLTGVMMDRLGLLMPRLAAVSPGADIAAADMLLDLRVGLNVLALHRERGCDKLAPVLAGVAAHYRGNPLAAPDPALLQKIDAAMAALPPNKARALMVLVGLRSVLFPAAPAPKFCEEREKEDVLF